MPTLTDRQIAALEAFADCVGAYGWKSKLWAAWQSASYPRSIGDHAAELQSLRNSADGYRLVSQFSLRAPRTIAVKARGFASAEA